MSIPGVGFIETVGFLISCCIQKKRKEALHKLSAENITFYESVSPGTVTYNRFCQFLSFVGFSGKNTHEEATEDDKIFRVLEIYVIFTEKYKFACVTMMYVTVNERLVSFREQCPIRQCTTLK
jgi:hypothetical protein